jgi:predicted metal-binding membrane protein
MVTARRVSLRLQHNAILALLLAIAAAAWTALVWQQSGHVSSMEMPMASPNAGREASLFIANWVVMMVAMMFPAAAPMALTFHGLRAVTRPLENAFVSTWVFVSAYLLVWAIAGLSAYAALLTARYAFTRLALSTTVTNQLGDASIVVAGVYQLTPLKELCLSKCREPIRFIANSWHDDTASAFRMGLVYGVYCVGCCWLLFVILFPFGMDVISMIAVTLIILAERRTLSWSQPISHVAGLALLLSGVFIIVMQQLLPMSKPSGMTMPAEMLMEMPGGGPASDVR